jgi:hypothetical protein
MRTSLRVTARHCASLCVTARHCASLHVTTDRLVTPFTLILNSLRFALARQQRAQHHPSPSLLTIPCRAAQQDDVYNTISFKTTKIDLASGTAPLEVPLAVPTTDCTDRTHSSAVRCCTRLNCRAELSAELTALRCCRTLLGPSLGRPVGPPARG